MLDVERTTISFSKQINNSQEDFHSKVSLSYLALAHVEVFVFIVFPKGKKMCKWKTFIYL